MKKKNIEDYKKLSKKAFIFSIIPYIIPIIIIMISIIFDPMNLWFLVAYIWSTPIVIPIFASIAISNAIKSIKIKRNPLAITSICLASIPIIFILIFIIF
ncbi:MAG: hypothetical protein IJA30_03060 [Bacilli bacterium]|nr:hypothetical protein [Bacilli bacterium]